MKTKSHFYSPQLVFAIFIVISIFSLFDIKKVRGDSMFSTFKDNDFLLIFRAMYGMRSPFFNTYLIKWHSVRKGDIVMYKICGKYVVKRCYATDEDVIYFYQKSDNEKTQYFMKVEEKDILLTKEAYYRLFLNSFKKEKGGMQKVPNGCLLLLGDNTHLSFDSRNYGYIMANSILGKVIRWR